jgi:hypothetical protein
MLAGLQLGDEAGDKESLLWAYARDEQEAS